MPTTSARSVDGAVRSPGEVGHVWLRRRPDTPAAHEYLGATAERREGGWESLGDLGYLDGEGYLYLTDRDSDMILVGGPNV